MLKDHNMKLQGIKEVLYSSKVKLIDSFSASDFRF